MGVGGGAGNPISFSQLRDFYGDDQNQPVSLSEYNRGGNLVPQTFAGSQTNTQGSTNQTVDDFGITVSTTQSFTGTMADSELVTRATTSVSGSSNAGTALTLSYTVLASDAQIRIFGGGFNQMGGGENPQSSAGYTSSGILNLGSQGAMKQYDGPAVNGRSGFSGSLNANFVQGTLTTGTFTLATTAGTHSGSLTVQTARRNGVNLNDVTIQNNSSVSTYTLTSDSTRASDNAADIVYAPGASKLVKDDSSTPNYSISYDKVTGSGAGSAGDIDVSVASVFTGSFAVAGNNATLIPRITFAASSSYSGVSYTVQASDATIGIELPLEVNQAEDTNPNSGTLVVNVNGGTQYSISASGSGRTPGAHFAGPAANGATLANVGAYPNQSALTTLSAGDVINCVSFSGQGGSSGAIATQRRTVQYKAVFTNSSQSESYTLEGGSGKTTGISSGSVVMSPNDTRDATSPGNSTTPSWEIHFDTSSGDCNTNIPTTIGAGNPINMDLFNAPGTPVG